MSVSSSAHTTQIWNQLMTIFASEMNVGPGGAGTGDNVTGRLQTVLDLERSVALKRFPSVGVQFLEDEFDFSGSSRFNYKATFYIIIGAIAAINDQSQVDLSSANMQLEAIMDDGNGNGIMPILLDPRNYQLGGLINTAMPKGWRFSWQSPQDTQDDPRAFAVLTYEVWAQVARR